MLITNADWVSAAEIGWEGHDLEKLADSGMESMLVRSNVPCRMDEETYFLLNGGMMLLR